MPDSAIDWSQRICRDSHERDSWPNAYLYHPAFYGQRPQSIRPL